METNSELLNTQSSAGETHKQNYGEETTLREPIGDTGFIAIKQDGGWFLVMGNHKVSREYATVGEAEDAVSGVDWEVMTNVICVIVKELKKLEQEAEVQAPIQA